MSTELEHPGFAGTHRTKTEVIRALNYGFSLVARELDSDTPVGPLGIKRRFNPGSLTPQERMYCLRQEFSLTAAARVLGTGSVSPITPLPENLTRSDFPVEYPSHPVQDRMFRVQEFLPVGVVIDALVREAENGNRQARDRLQILLDVVEPFLYANCYSSERRGLVEARKAYEAYLVHRSDHSAVNARLTREQADQEGDWFEGKNYLDDELVVDLSKLPEVVIPANTPRGRRRFPVGCLLPIILAGSCAFLTSTCSEKPNPPATAPIPTDTPTATPTSTKEPTATPRVVIVPTPTQTPEARIHIDVEPAFYQNLPSDSEKSIKGYVEAMVARAYATGIMTREHQTEKRVQPSDEQLRETVAILYEKYPALMQKLVARYQTLTPQLNSDKPSKYFEGPNILAEVNGDEVRETILYETPPSALKGIISGTPKTPENRIILSEAADLLQTIQDNGQALR